MTCSMLQCKLERLLLDEQVCSHVRILHHCIVLCYILHVKAELDFNARIKVYPKCAGDDAIEQQAVSKHLEMFEMTGGRASIAVLSMLAVEGWISEEHATIFGKASNVCLQTSLLRWNHKLEIIIKVLVLSQISIHPQKKISAYQQLTRPSCFLCRQKTVPWLKNMFLHLLLHSTESIRMQKMANHLNPTCAARHIWSCHSGPHRIRLHVRQGICRPSLQNCRCLTSSKVSL